jgi:hypothetical protein
MQFKVPQNIDMQDKIIGPLTLPQFFYLLFGGVIIYILFNKLVLNGLTFIFVILAVPIGLFSLAMAFVKVQDRPFPSFVMAAIKYMSLPRARVWQHVSEEQKKPMVAPRKAEAPKVAAKRLDDLRAKELAGILDTPIKAKESNGQG